MDKQKMLRISYLDRDTVIPIYANQSSVMFNPFEFNIEFAHIDGINATSALSAGEEEITARCVSKIVLSHKAMLELQETINHVVEQFKIQSGEK
jgi:hypothetical protein